jgi:hypothetical protein
VHGALGALDVSHDMPQGVPDGARDGMPWAMSAAAPAPDGVPQGMPPAPPAPDASGREAGQGKPAAFDAWLWAFVAVTFAGLGVLTLMAPATSNLALSLVARFAPHVSAPGGPVEAQGLRPLVESLLPAPAQPPCQVVLGFALLEAYVGPSVVGRCTENEQFNSISGTSQQRTSGGLFVWYKADNVLAFTDGHQTWLRGPLGFQQRLNTQRFCWEAGAAPGRCR